MVLIGPKRRNRKFFCVRCMGLKIWRGRRDSNSRPLPWQRSAVRFYNNLKERGDCRTPRKSQKTSHFVGWVVDWETLSPTNRAVRRRILPDNGCSGVRECSGFFAPTDRESHFSELPSTMKPETFGARLSYASSDVNDAVTMSGDCVCRPTRRFADSNLYNICGRRSSTEVDG